MGTHKNELGIYGNKMSYPNSTLHELLEQQAQSTPNAFALQDGNERVTYADLQLKINQMALYLRANGVVKGQIVALSLDRSTHFVVSLFAILKCGATYVPIDKDYPFARKEF